MSKISDLNTELEQYVEDVEDIKSKIEDIATNKNVIIVEGTDTPLSVLTKIDTNTIETPTESLTITENGTYNVTNYAEAAIDVSKDIDNITLSKTIDKTNIFVNGGVLSNDSFYDTVDDVVQVYGPITLGLTPSPDDGDTVINRAYARQADLIYNAIAGSSINESDYTDEKLAEYERILINVSQGGQNNG